MVALLESAKNDIAKTIKLWQNEKQSIMSVEYFSEKKLAYFCLKAIEAIWLTYI